MTHRILTLGGPVHRFPAVGRCIYCNRAPPEVQLGDEHIIADGLGGDLLLPDASCCECARKTGRSEQQVLRELLMQPRGALGIRSRKKRPKQTSIRMRVGPGGDFVEKDIPFAPGMPPFLALFVTDLPPGILRGVAPEDECGLHAVTAAPLDFYERCKATVGSDNFGFGVRLHAGIFGQVVAKTAHAFAVAALGADRFVPFLTEYIRADEPPFDCFHIGATLNVIPSEAVHEIALRRVMAPQFTIVGVTWREVYVVHLRLLANLVAPAYAVVIGKPV